MVVGCRKCLVEFLMIPFFWSFFLTLETGSLLLLPNIYLALHILPFVAIFLEFEVDTGILVDIVQGLFWALATTGSGRFQLAIFSLDKSLLAIDTEADGNEIIHDACETLKVDFVEADGSFKLLILFYLTNNLVVEISGVSQGLGSNSGHRLNEVG